MMEKPEERNNSRVGKLRAGMLRKPEICVERACLWTESYKETESEPSIIRRAKALKHVLKNMTVIIEDGELIVGRTTSKRRGCMIFPEVQWEWFIEEKDLLSTREWDTIGPISDEEKSILVECLPYWKGKCTFEKWNARLPEDVVRIHNKLFSTGTGSMSGVHWGHETIDYERLLRVGLRGIKDDVNNRMAQLDLTDVDDYSKWLFLRAVNITLDATIDFAARYADLARDMAGKEKDSRRKAELEKIADTCARVPLNPAGSFQEALQSIWLVHIAVRIEGWGPGLSFGRVDQYLFPYYEKDVNEGNITRNDAKELLSLFLVKVNDLAPVMATFAVETLGGFPTMVSMTIGGVDRKGYDAVNELTCLFLESDTEVSLNAEEITARISRKNSDAYLRKACETANLLKGKLKFVSDETIIRQLLGEGRPAEHARDYVLAGCFTPGVPGRSLDVTAGTINLPFIFELALNNGISRISGEQLGLKTGDPRKFKSYDEVWEAYKKQVEHVIPRLVTSRNIDVGLYADLLQCPLMSSLHEGCIEKGRDILNGGTYPWAREAHGFSGLPNVGDSLAAIKKVVFEDKIAAMDQLIDALEADFKGYDFILRSLEKAPKFGNNDDYVDTIVNDIIIHFDEVLADYRGIFGKKPGIAAATGTMHLLMGKMVGALPDGRKAGEPFAEGGISPHQGRNVSGPTATLMSVAKLDHLKMTGGSVLNMKFNPDVFGDDLKIKKFMSMLRAYCENGGFHVQFNIISSDTLRDAQKHPEKYRDLLVRVATYSSYFAELSPKMQDDIIARMEFQQI